MRKECGGRFKVGGCEPGCTTHDVYERFDEKMSANGLLREGDVFVDEMDFHLPCMSVAQSKKDMTKECYQGTCEHGDVYAPTSQRIKSGVLSIESSYFLMPILWPFGASLISI